MTIPDDLRVRFTGTKVELYSGDAVVTIDYRGGRGPFQDGPIAWKTLCMAYLEPALSQLNEHNAARTVSA